MRSGTWQRRTMGGAAAAAVLCGLMVAGATPAAAAAGLVNGGFEQPAIEPSVFQTFHAGESVGGWQVTQGSVDVVHTRLYAAAEGVQSLDLNGEEPGTVQQNLSTLPLLSYKVTFSLAGDPSTQREVAGQVLADGAVIKDFTFDTTGKSYDNMGWTTATATFQATGTSTALAFRGVTPSGASGAMIDNVRIQKCLLVLCLPANLKTNKHGK